MVVSFFTTTESRRAQGDGRPERAPALFRHTVVNERRNCADLFRPNRLSSHHLSVPYRNLSA